MWSQFLAAVLATIAANPLATGANPVPSLSAAPAEMTALAEDAVASILSQLNIETIEDLGFLYSSADEAKEAGAQANIPSLVALENIPQHIR